MSEQFDELDNLDQYEEESVGLRPEDKKHAKTNDLEWFKGEKGVSYRVSLVYFDPLVVSSALKLRAFTKAKGQAPPTKEQLIEVAKKALAKRAEELNKPVDQLQDYEKLDLSQTQFKKIMAHYKEGVGFVVSRLGKDGAQADEVWRMLGDQKPYFCTVLLVYPANRQGELDKANLLTNWKVMPWRISSKVYGQFHGQASSLRNNDLSIADQDLIITCTNSEYQNFEKMEGAGKALWRKNPEFQGKILAKAHTLYDKLKPFRELSTADLRIKLGVQTDNPGENVSTDDMEDLLNNV